MGAEKTDHCLGVFLGLGVAGTGEVPRARPPTRQGVPPAIVAFSYGSMCSGMGRCAPVWVDVHRYGSKYSGGLHADIYEPSTEMQVATAVAVPDPQLAEQYQLLITEGSSAPSGLEVSVAGTQLW